MSQYAASIPVSSNHTTFTVRAGRNRSRKEGTAANATALSPADRETVEDTVTKLRDLKAKKRERPAKSKPVTHRLPERAAEFQQVMGERVDITWGVGPQQMLTFVPNVTEMTTSGTVAEVTDTYVLLEDVIGGAAVRSFIPFGFVVRWQQ